MIEDLIHLVSLTDNVYLQKQLELIQKTLLENPNDSTLGAKLRKLLN